MDADKAYVLMKGEKPLVAHTTLQGAAMEMVGYDADNQKGMYVAPIELIDDHAD